MAAAAAVAAAVEVEEAVRLPQRSWPCVQDLLEIPGTGTHKAVFQSAWSFCVCSSAIDASQR
jgi:hypothetical protein